MMNIPQLSIILPVYNSEPFLEETIRCVQRQSFQDFELIIIDDGSTDSSSRICDRLASHDDRIKVVHQKNQGVSAARNTGLDLAKGTFVAFVDHDDYITSDFYKTMLDQIGDSDLIISAVWGGKREDWGKTPHHEIDDQQTVLAEVGEGDNFPLIDVANNATIWNQIFKKEIIETNSLRFMKMNSEDEIFSYAYMSLCSKIKKINYQGYYFVDTPNSLGSHHSYIAEYDYISLMESYYMLILKHWKIKDSHYIDKIKYRIQIRQVSFLLKGYYLDTRVSYDKRKERWMTVKGDTFTRKCFYKGKRHREKLILSLNRLCPFALADLFIRKVLATVGK